MKVCWSSRVFQWRTGAQNPSIHSWILCNEFLWRLYRQLRSQDKSFDFYAILLMVLEFNTLYTHMSFCELLGICLDCFHSLYRCQWHIQRWRHFLYLNFVCTLSLVSRFLPRAVRNECLDSYWSHFDSTRPTWSIILPRADIFDYSTCFLDTRER